MVLLRTHDLSWRFLKARRRTRSTMISWIPAYDIPGIIAHNQSLGHKTPNRQESEARQTAQKKTLKKKILQEEL